MIFSKKVKASEDISKKDGGTNIQNKQKTPHPSKSNKYSFFLLWSYLKEEKRNIFLGVSCLVLAVVLNLAIPLFLKYSLIEGSQNFFNIYSLKFIFFLAAIFIIQGFFLFYRHFYFVTIGYNFAFKLREKLFSSLLNLENSFFDQSLTGDLTSRLSSDVTLLQRVVGINSSVLIRYLLQVVGGTLMMFYISLKLSLVIVILLPFLVIGGSIWGKKLKKISKNLQSGLGKLSALESETLNGISTVKIFTAENLQITQHKVITEETKTISKYRSKFAAQFTSSMVVMMNITILFLFWYGIRLVNNAEMTKGDLTAYIGYAAIVAVSFGFIVNVLDEFFLASGAMSRIFEIIDLENSQRFIGETSDLVTVSQNSRPQPEAVPGSPLISFKNVSFSYPTRSEQLALNDVTFEIERGKSLALVGPSGGGKSTIVSLIPKFYEAALGKIEFEGVDIKEINSSILRSRISIVPQNVHIFSSSIFENIILAEPKSSEEDVWKAIEFANLKTFVQSLPEGIHTKVGEFGIQLSGGQKQRIAIARAMLKNSELLILDEATSSLDSENEVLIKQSIERLMTARTTLIIAHRLSTVTSADKVLVLKEGQIIQSGTHQELIKEQGLYQNLVNLQMLTS